LDARELCRNPFWLSGRGPKFSVQDMWNFWAGAKSSAFLSLSKKKKGGAASRKGRKKEGGPRLDDEPSPIRIRAEKLQRPART
jgi:hypothetical protein